MSSAIDEKTGEILLFHPDASRCPQPMYAELRSKCPVGRAHFTASPVVSRFEDVVWALRHPEIFSSEMGEQLKLGNPRPMIPQQIDPPDQTRYRRLLDPLFSRKRMLALAPAVRKHANELIDAFASAGECEFDEAFAIPLPCTAFLALFGLPASDLPSFLDMKDGIIRPHKFIAAPKSNGLEDMQVHIALQADYRKQTADRMFAYFEEAISPTSRSARRPSFPRCSITRRRSGWRISRPGARISWAFRKTSVPRRGKPSGDSGTSWCRWPDSYSCCSTASRRCSPG
jgi:cytochrome P450